MVVTRDQATGQKQIYIDGQLNNSDVAYAGLLNAPQMVIFGAAADASQSNPNSPAADASNGYVGQMDQVQIYSRVLSSSEIAYLYQNPGAVVSSVILGGTLRSGANFEFSFVSTAGHTNYLQYTTNLANPNWLPYSTIVGDGTLKLVTVPANQHAAAFFRVSTQ